MIRGGALDHLNEFSCFCQVFFILICLMFTLSHRILRYPNTCELTLARFVVVEFLDSTPTLPVFLVNCYFSNRRGAHQQQDIRNNTVNLKIYRLSFLELVTIEI